MRHTNGVRRLGHAGDDAEFRSLPSDRATSFGLATTGAVETPGWAARRRHGMAPDRRLRRLGRRGGVEGFGKRE